MNLTYVGTTFSHIAGAMTTNNYLWVSSDCKIYTAAIPVTLLVTMPPFLSNRKIYAVSDSLFWQSGSIPGSLSYKVKKFSFNGSAVTELLMLPHTFDYNYSLYANSTYVHYGQDNGIFCYDVNGTYCDTALSSQKVIFFIAGDSAYLYVIYYDKINQIYYLNAYSNNIGNYILLASTAITTAPAVGVSPDFPVSLYATERKAHILIQGYVTGTDTYVIYGFNGSTLNLESSVDVYTGEGTSGKIVVSDDEYALIGIKTGRVIVDPWGQNIYKIYKKNVLKYTTSVNCVYNHATEIYYWHSKNPSDDNGYFAFNLNSSTANVNNLYRMNPDQFDTTTVNWIP